MALWVLFNNNVYSVALWVLFNNNVYSDETYKEYPTRARSPACDLSLSSPTIQFLGPCHLTFLRVLQGTISLCVVNSWNKRMMNVDCQMVFQSADIAFCLGIFYTRFILSLWIYFWCLFSVINLYTFCCYLIWIWAVRSQVWHPKCRNIFLICLWVSCLKDLYYCSWLHIFLQQGFLYSFWYMEVPLCSFQGAEGYFEDGKLLVEKICWLFVLQVGKDNSLGYAWAI